MKKKMTETVVKDIKAPLSEIIWKTLEVATERLKGTEKSGQIKFKLNDCDVEVIIRSSQETDA